MGGCPTISVSLVGLHAVNDVILCGLAWWLQSGDRQKFVSLTKIVRKRWQNTVNLNCSIYVDPKLSIFVGPNCSMFVSPNC